MKYEIRILEYIILNSLSLRVATMVIVVATMVIVATGGAVMS
jgi:hypothetical protein